MRHCAGATLLPLVLRTLTDYQPFALTAFCRDCDRSVVLDKEALAERYGWDSLLEDLRRRLTCQQCGRRPERLLAGYYLAAVPNRHSSASTVNPSNRRRRRR